MTDPFAFDPADPCAFDGAGAVKTLDDEGRFEGLAVPFGDPDLTRQRDRFGPDTNFGRALKNGADLLYYHGLPTVGPREPNPLADAILGEAEFKTVDAGIWMTGQMRLRDEYELKVWQMAKAGKLGLSTGVASHRVRREKLADGTHQIKTWPIDEVSFTPSPANPRTAVYAIKTLLTEAGLRGLGADAGSAVALGGLSTLSDEARHRIADHLRDDKLSRDEKLAACKGCLDAHAAIGHRLISAMLGDDPDPQSIKALVDGFGTAAPAGPFLESCLRAASDLEGIASRFAKIGPAKLHAIKSLRDSLDGLLRKGAPDPASIAASRASIDRLLDRLKGR